MYDCFSVKLSQKHMQIPGGHNVIHSLHDLEVAVSPCALARLRERKESSPTATTMDNRSKTCFLRNIGALELFDSKKALSTQTEACGSSIIARGAVLVT